VRARIGNDEIADVLDRVADLLATQDANPYRVRAWREGARVVRAHPTSVAALADERGVKALDELPGIGRSLSQAIDEIVHRGRLRLLERLEGEVSPEDLFSTVPGIGEELAHRLHEALDVETLEELELAAHDGRLEKVPGFGPRRARAVRDSLGMLLSRSARRRARLVRHAETAGPTPEPPVELLLEVDAEYREKAEAGKLRRIAPRRFNPTGEAWLPVLHAEREGWHFTALYSNTARAHQLGTTRDWVVIFFDRDGDERQCTVVTERHGPLQGRRVVRGRERESAGGHGGEGDGRRRAGA
jgi:hypothetical protein